MEKYEMKGCEISKKEIKKICEYRCDKIALISAVIMFIALNMCIYFLIHRIYIVGVIIIGVFCMLYYIIDSIVLTILKTKKMYKSYEERMLLKYDVSFSDYSIHIISSEEKLKMEYKSISKIFENEIEYVFISNANRYIIIPKKCVGNENQFNKYINDLINQYKIRQVIKMNNII